MDSQYPSYGGSGGVDSGLLEDDAQYFIGGGEAAESAPVQNSIVDTNSAGHVDEFELVQEANTGLFDGVTGVAGLGYGSDDSCTLLLVIVAVNCG